MYLYLCLYLYFCGSVRSDTNIHWLWGHWTPAFSPVLYFNLNLYLYFYGSPIPWVDRKVEGHLHLFSVFVFLWVSVRSDSNKHWQFKGHQQTTQWWLQPHRRMSPRIGKSCIWYVTVFWCGICICIYVCICIHICMVFVFIGLTLGMAASICCFTSQTLRT